MEKTYVFDTADNGDLNSSALIASLMQNKGVDPNLMAMLTNASHICEVLDINPYSEEAAHMSGDLA